MRVGGGPRAFRAEAGHLEYTRAAASASPSDMDSSTENESLKHCVALLRTRDFEKRRRAIKYMTRLAKQGLNVLIRHDEGSVLGDIVEYIQSDEFEDEYAVLKLLRWATMTSQSLMAVVANSSIISFLKQKVRQSDNRCLALCFRTWANILAYDTTMLVIFVDDGLLSDVFQVYDRMITKIERDDEALDVVNAILGVMPVIVVNPTCLGTRRSEHLQSATTCILQCITHPCRDVTAEAVRALCCATDVNDTSIITMFFREHYFDRFLSLCNSPSPSIAATAITAMTHFGLLDDDDVRRFLLPLFTRLHFTSDDTVLMATLWAAHRLVHKAGDIAGAVVSCEFWATITENVQSMTCKHKELYSVILCRALRWRLTDLVTNHIPMFANLIWMLIEILPSATPKNRKDLLTGLFEITGYLALFPSPDLLEPLNDEQLREILQTLASDPDSASRADAILTFIAQHSSS